MENLERPRESGRNSEEKSSDEDVLIAAQEHGEDMNDGFLKSKSPGISRATDGSVNSRVSDKRFNFSKRISSGEVSKIRQSSETSGEYENRPRSSSEQEHSSSHGSNEKPVCVLSSKTRLVEALEHLEQLQRQQLDVLRKFIQSNISDDDSIEDEEVQSLNTEEELASYLDNDTQSRCSITDIPGFVELSRYAIDIPSIGLLDLRLTKAFIESCELPDALQIFKRLRSDIKMVDSSAHSMHIFILDQIFCKSLEKLFVPASVRSPASWFSSQALVPGKGCIDRDMIQVPHTLGRIQIFQGLTTLEAFCRDGVFIPLFQQSLCGFDNYILHQHLDCVDAAQFSTPRAFQFSFYEIVPDNVFYEGWPRGNLWNHTDQPGPKIRKSCVTFLVDTRLPEVSCEWAIIICCPSSFFGTSVFGLPLNCGIDSGHKSGLVTFLESVESCLVKALSGWELIWDELNIIFEHSQETTFLKPDEYAHFLYDEASFPRSRFYFWAIGCLSAFDDNINTNLRNLHAFRKQWKDGLSFKDEFGRPIVSKAEIGHITNVDKKMEELSGKLKNVSERMAKRLADVRALRDGLFSASGVMESRQSRILSENVRLLTFVSIFFLPLSFIVAFWSVPAVNTTWPGVPYPIIVSTITGTITYLTVFNLNSLTALIHKIVQKPRNFILGEMAKWHGSALKDDDSSIFSEDVPKTRQKTNWSAKARAFEVFPRPETNPKPSEWLLIWFGIKLICQALWSWALRLWNLVLCRSEPVVKKDKGKGVQRDDVESQSNEEVIEMTTA